MILARGLETPRSPTTATDPTPLAVPPTAVPRSIADSANVPAEPTARPTPPSAEPKTGPVSAPLSQAQPTPTIQPTTAPAVSGPAEAVESFYSLVEQHRFGTAAQLWSPRMQAQYPPGENIWSRFSQVSTLTVQRADVISIDQSAGRATVAVDLLEVGGSPATTRRWVGTWQLVRGGSGWLLDQPSLRAG